MFKGLFGRKKITHKSDVALAVVGALYALWKAQETWNEYKEDHPNKEITQ